MPFVSIRVIQSEVAPEFIQFSAGQDQNVICASIVELEAQVLVGDINNHTFEWEQLEGTPVVLENADTLTPWFINPNTTDFVFRFWIDRGTPFERFDDVNVFRNLASTLTLYPGTSSGLLPHQLLNPDVARTTSDARMPVDPKVEISSYYDQNGTYLSGQHWEDTNPYAITWLRPTTGMSARTILDSVEIQRYNTGTQQWETVGSQIPERQYYNIENGFLYRLVMVWEDTLRGTISRETDGKIFKVRTTQKPGLLVPNSVYTSSISSSAGATSNSEFSAFIPSKIEYEVEATYTALSGSASGATTPSTFSVFIPDLIDQDVEATYSVSGSGSGASNPNVYILRANGISIGQGD